MPPPSDRVTNGITQFLASIVAELRLIVDHTTNGPNSIGFDWDLSPDSNGPSVFFIWPVGGQSPLTPVDIINIRHWTLDGVFAHFDGGGSNSGGPFFGCTFDSFGHITITGFRDANRVEVHILCRPSLWGHIRFSSVEGWPWMNHHFDPRPNPRTAFQRPPSPPVSFPTQMELIEMEERTRRRTELYQRLADLPQELERERLERERTAPDFRVRGAPFPSHFASQQDLMREAAMTVDSNPIVYHVTKEAWEQMKESVSPPASSFWDRLGEDL